MIQPPRQSNREIAYRVGIAVALCLSFLALIFVINLAGEGSAWILLLLLLVILITTCVFFYNKVQTLAQKRRDDFAVVIFNQARAGNIEKFALFLRPFYVTGKLKKEILVPTYSGGTGSQPGNVTFQTQIYHLAETIIKAFKKVMPIVALGKPGEVQGIGRILADENAWKVAASELLRDASLIICIPSGHPGTIWELNEILRNHYLIKVVLLMPPDPSDPTRKFFRREWRAMIDDWNAGATI
jgi:hypothetical protein